MNDTEILNNNVVEEKDNVTLEMSEELKNLLGFIKTELSQDLPTLSIDVNYFLLGALAHKKNSLFIRLESCMTSMGLEALYNTFYKVIASKTISAVKPNRVPSVSSDLFEYLSTAEEEAKKMGATEYTSEHVFLAILLDNDSKIKKLFNKAGITYGTMKSKIEAGSPMNSMPVQKITLPDGTQGEIRMFKAKDKDEAIKMINQMMGNRGDMEDMGMEMPGFSKKKKGKGAYIKDYCINLNDLVMQGKMERLIGREKEVNEIIRILGRKKKNNAILVGGEGVGKTAIGESIAWKIVNGDVPDFLIGRQLVSLDMTAIMAGTTLRGMFEERVKGVLDNIRDDNSYILFMDNIGAIMADKGKNDFELSAMLSRALETGEIQVIGTSDFASYRKTFDKDPSLARRFHKIIVEAPSEEESINILNGIKGSYEAFHSVVFDDDAITACVKLANTYITERNLPDSAIDLIDEIGALKGTVNEPEKLKELRSKIFSLESQIDDLKKKENFSEADELEKEAKKLRSEYNGRKKQFEEEKAANPIRVTKNDILDMVSIKTGIPAHNLSSDDKKKLVGMNDRIKESVIGQNEAIDTICKALKRSRIGLRKQGCMYSALAIGKTGVGKTLIAKKLAKELFGNESALVRFDMSEYSDKISVNKLIGSTPGYVGYEEGGQLTEAIKNKKHCVLLLDEIEKADPEVYNIFLQVLDEGFLTDNSGMRVDFGNVIVIFTSNVGAKAASEFGRGIGFKEDEDTNTKKILLKQLKNRFPPEFLNRIDDVIYFNSLTDENLKDIIKIEMNKLNDNLKAIGYSMTYDDASVDYVLNIVKDEKEYGARPIMRAIQDEIEDKITDSILENSNEEGYVFVVSCDDNNNVIVR